jgi:transcriptional regulator with GAF, ATPase, and Fis domain
MSRAGRVDLAKLDAALAALLGHKLFTAMRYHDDTGESERIYTNQPRAYPVGGRKAMNATPWAQQVIHEGRPYLGRTAADIKAVFFDWELIASLGCASVLNLPVVADGRLLGTLNLLHEEGWYDDEDIPVGLQIAALAAPMLRPGTAPR